jgi:hypothetical protein
MREITYWILASDMLGGQNKKGDKGKYWISDRSSEFCTFANTELMLRRQLIPPGRIVLGHVNKHQKNIALAPTRLDDTLAKGF